MTDWRLNRKAAPLPIVTVEEMKDQLRIDGTAEDFLLQRYIAAATDAIEGPYGIGVLLGSQTWEYFQDVFTSILEIPLFPVISVDEISYVDSAGATQALNSSDYRADTVSNPARIVSAHSSSWPTTRSREPNAVKITFTGGHNSVPEALRAAVIMWAAHMYENRLPVIVGTTASNMPLAVNDILDRYRVVGIG